MEDEEKGRGHHIIWPIQKVALLQPSSKDCGTVDDDHDVKCEIYIIQFFVYKSLSLVHIIGIIFKETEVGGHHHAFSIVLLQNPNLIEK